MVTALTLVDTASAQGASGSIRGVVYDADFDVPLPGVEVTNTDTGETVSTSDQGSYLFAEVAPGSYTLVFAKPGYARQVRAGVVVTAGALTDADARLTGDFAELDEFVVQDILRGAAGAEIALLQVRFESPAFVDSISSELMSRAGASDAASALKLISGTTVQDGKFAVVRGLPDRYVNSQLNRIRLPTADEDKRAVELDQFPSAAIESVQISKTFTPDQQGDASGGAVNIVLKRLPNESVLEWGGLYAYNTQVTGEDDFLTYEDGGVSYWGRESNRDPQPVGTNWSGAVGTSREEAPIDYKWLLGGGSSVEIDQDVRLGAYASLFYDRSSAYTDDGRDFSFWVDTPGAGLVPEEAQASVDPRSKLFDWTQGVQGVQWGGLGIVGLETDDHLVNLTWLRTHTAEDRATLAIDTTGKEFFFGPGYDPNDPTGPGNTPSEVNLYPYLRLETLEYTERTTETFQLAGEHTLPLTAEVGDGVRFTEPRLDWSVSQSTAKLHQPDKRQFGAAWLAPSFSPGIPPVFPPSTSPPTWIGFKPEANFTLGNAQRIFKDIDEQSRQLSVNLKLPFDLPSGDSGYLKSGVFYDVVDRRFDQDTFSNFGDNTTFIGDFFLDPPWSEVFPTQGTHPITDGPPFVDVDYEADQKLRAAYGMVDYPLGETVSVVGGARFEATEIDIVNFPEQDAQWFPDGATGPVKLLPGEADVAFRQNDILPALGVSWQATDEVRFRLAYSRTVARQTFKELTPILQQEFLGGPIFIGNPELGMSDVDNYDFRADYEPYQGGLVSASLFKKDIDDPIENVQKNISFTFTTAENYPKGEIEGLELEVRHDLGRTWRALDGLLLGGNATFIDGTVQLPEDEILAFAAPNIQAPRTERDMTNAPEYLYNLYAIYDVAATGTSLALFYTVKGDTLVAGAGEDKNNFIPDIYELERETLNFSLTQRLGKYVTLKLEAKNLTDSAVQEVYRSEFINGDTVNTSYREGIDFSVSLGARFVF